MVRIGSVLALAVAPAALAHPGDDKKAISREMAMRTVQHRTASRSLANCQNSAAALEVRERAAARRANKARELRTKRGLHGQPVLHQKRDLASLEKWTALSHNETTLGYTLDTPADIIFGSNNTCALVPETTVGPYYVTGEEIRSDIGEGQVGVPLHFELQFVDMTTCAPVTNLIADVWHCNSTGWYSGVEGQGGLDSTFMRGVQISDDDGVVSFDTLFPGHYDRRLTHIHVVAQADATVLPNSTFTGGTTKHIGQLYFDDALIQQVEATSPYNTNTIAFTSIEDDGWGLDEATEDYDPYMEYVQLGSDLTDGLLTWITIAVDQSSDHSSNLTAAAHYYEGGGVCEGNCGNNGPPPDE
ncbi:Intradiol ring-cleavage dioxygenase [Xylariomycetidae sp. FL2044]|nr:Intradiol ring-cleavage dioxygenase [Xylariomycetidae sp. FL2044]